MLLITLYGLLAGVPTYFLMREDSGLWRSVLAYGAGLVTGLLISFLVAVVVLHRVDFEVNGLIGGVLGPLGVIVATRRMRMKPLPKDDLRLR